MISRLFTASAAVGVFGRCAQSANQRPCVADLMAPVAHGVLDRRKSQSNAALVGWAVDLNLFFDGEQLDQRQTHERPMKFRDGVVGSTTTQLASAECLFERSELQLNSPTEPIKLSCVSRRQFPFRQDVRHEIDLAARALKREQPQDEGRLLPASNLVWPEINQPSTSSRRAEIFQQANVASYTDQKAVAVVQNTIPKLVADKAGITAKQRILREIACLEHLGQMATLARSGRTRAPAPRQFQADVPNQGQPNLRLDWLGDPLAAPLFVFPLTPCARLLAVPVVLDGKGLF